jgi:hypothetical protein
LPRQFNSWRASPDNPQQKHFALQSLLASESRGLLWLTLSKKAGGSASFLLDYSGLIGMI